MPAATPHRPFRHPPAAEDRSAAPDPIAAIATAAGRAAVGIVRISGGRLLPLAQALTARAQWQPRTAHYGAFVDADGSAIDHGLAIHFPAPHSYTGEDVLELQAHGGPVVLQLLLARCLQAAAQTDADGRPLLPRLRLARPGEFTERAFLNGKLDLAQAEAVMDLINASTESAARGASRSLSGAFSRDIATLQQRLTNLRMLVEATIDFPEEETEVLTDHGVAGQIAAAQQALQVVQARARQGALLQAGMKIVIAGQPNAGKSSLLNALAGAELAIVTPIAGTTRDAVGQTIQIEGVPLHVLDTAGLREGGDEVERIGIERAWGHIANADAVLLLHDLTRAGDAECAAQDAAIADGIARQAPPGVPVLHVFNKSDAAPQGAMPGAVPPDALAISARTGDGLPALRQRLLQMAGWQAGGSEDIYTARQRHLQALQAAAEHLLAAAEHLRAPAPMLELLAEELRLAQSQLGKITGEFSADDLLGEIFSRFCIGK